MVHIPREFIMAIIFNLTTGSRIDIPLLPETISEEYSAQFDNIPVLGRSTPYAGYGGGGPRSISLDLPMHVDYSDGQYLDKIQRLKALPYPEYEDYIEPPKVYVKIGDFIAIIGYCDSVSVAWNKPYGFDTNGNKVYYKADISLSIKEALKYPYSASEVEGGMGTGRIKPANA